MSWWNAVLPVLTLALGWLGSEFSDARRDARAQARAREDREQALAERNRDRREAFERDTLHALYSALSRLGRAAAVHHFADLAAAKQTGRPYAGSVLPDDSPGEEVRLANVEAGRHALLVLDDGLRARVESARDAVNALGWSQSTIEEADAMFQRSTAQLMTVMREVAARLRELYSDDAVSA